MKSTLPSQKREFVLKSLRTTSNRKSISSVRSCTYKIRAEAPTRKACQCGVTGGGLCRAQGWGQGSLMEALPLSPKPGRSGEACGSLSPLHPGVPVGPSWHPGRGRLAFSAPTAQCQQHPRSLRQDRKAQSSLRGHPRPTVPAWAHHCDRSRGVRGSEPPAQQAGIAGRPGKSWLGRSRQGRAGEEQRAAGSLAGRLGHRAAGAPGNCPRQPRSDIGLPAGNHPPPPGACPPQPCPAHQLTPRAESLSVGHLTLTRAAPGTGHRGFLPGPRLC